MTAAGSVVLLVVIATVVALATLTAVGEQRRGGRIAVVIAAGLFFPLAWVVWYRNDELLERESSS